LADTRPLTDISFKRYLHVRTVAVLRTCMRYT